MSFGILAVIVLAGLGGPLLGVASRGSCRWSWERSSRGSSSARRRLGRWIRRTATIATLGKVGFAMLMLTVGMHLPLSHRRLAASAREGALLAGVVCVLAVPAGLLAAAVAGSGHAAIYAVLLASGSAAVLLPALEETGSAAPRCCR